MTIYLITNYKFNHDPSVCAVSEPIDKRFIGSANRYIYYLIDDQLPHQLASKEHLFEKTFNPVYKKAGKKYLAEWATFLAEKEHQFAQYPMFIISSRFYQKNAYLQYNLDQLWDPLFQGLRKWEYGVLPSYDRPLRWISPNRKYTHVKYQKRFPFYPFKLKTFELVDDIYNIKVEKDFPFFTDFMCDYFGFATRAHFIEYMQFFQPIFDHFFTKDFELKVDLSDYFYVGCSTHRGEKPVTYLLEYFSHLFFVLKRRPFFAYHYSGLYEIYEREKKIIAAKQFPVRYDKRFIRFMRYLQQWIHFDSGLPAGIRGIVKRPFDMAESLIRAKNFRFLWPH